MRKTLYKSGFLGYVWVSCSHVRNAIELRALLESMKQFARHVHKEVPECGRNCLNGL